MSSRTSSSMSSNRRCRSNRWMWLLLVVLAVAMGPLAVVANEEDHGQAQEQHYEEEQQEEQYEEPEQQNEGPEQQNEEPEQQYEEEELVEKIQEEVVEETPTEVVEEVVEKAEGAVTGAKKKFTTGLGNIKDKVSTVANKIGSKSKALVDKVKGVDKADAKKVAAAVLGVWGVSVGVGWLAHTVKAGASDQSGAGKFNKPAFGVKK